LRLLSLTFFSLFAFHFLLANTLLLILSTLFLSSSLLFLFSFFSFLLLAHHLLLGGLLFFLILLLLAVVAVVALFASYAKNLHNVRRRVNPSSCSPKHLLQEEVCLFGLVTSDDLSRLAVNFLTDD